MSKRWIQDRTKQRTRDSMTRLIEALQDKHSKPKEPESKVKK